MDWEAKNANLIGALKFTILSMVCVYIVIVFAAALTGHSVPALDSWAGWVSVIIGISSGGIKFFSEYHKKTLSQAMNEK